MNVPKLRFKEFNDEYETYTINELGNVITGTTPSTSDKENYGNEFLWVSPIDMGIHKYIDNTKNKLSEKGFRKARAIPKDSVLITCIGSTIGKMAMASKVMATNQQINTLICNNNFNNNYMYYCIGYSFPKFLSKISFQAVPIISKSEFEKLSLVCSTNKQEQIKVANFLSLLDKKIELQTKKIEDLKLFKKGLNNSIIFKSSGTPIEIKNLVSEYNKKTTINNQYPVLSSTMNGITIQQEYFNKTASSNDTTGYKIVPNNYITYRSMSDTGQFHFNLQNIIDIGIVSPAYPVFKLNDNINLEYFLNYINNCQIFKNQILSIKEGGTRFALSFSKFNKLLVNIPEEQYMITYGNILNIINRKIKLEMEKVNKLQQLKKGLMQNMFV